MNSLQIRNQKAYRGDYVPEIFISENAEVKQKPNQV